MERASEKGFGFARTQPDGSQAPADVVFTVVGTEVNGVEGTVGPLGASGLSFAS